MTDDEERNLKTEITHVMECLDDLEIPDDEVDTIFGERAGILLALLLMLDSIPPHEDPSVEAMRESTRGIVAGAKRMLEMTHDMRALRIFGPRDDDDPIAGRRRDVTERVKAELVDWKRMLAALEGLDAHGAAREYAQLRGVLRYLADMSARAGEVERDAKGHERSRVDWFAISRAVGHQLLELDDTWARLSARRFFGDPPAATLRRLVQIVFMPWGDPPSEPESAP